MSYWDRTYEVFVTGDCQEDEERAEPEPACLVVHVEGVLGNIPTCGDGSYFHCFPIKGLLVARPLSSLFLHRKAMAVSPLHVPRSRLSRGEG